VSEDPKMIDTTTIDEKMKVRPPV
jgi:hypothetical protein